MRQSVLRKPAPFVSPGQRDRGAGRRRVYILARKTLRRNTRIFKQAKSLTDAGYEVLVIGVKPRDAPEWERRDGYAILRLRLAPLHGRIPRTVRRALTLIERGLSAIGARSAAARLHGLNVVLTEWLGRELGRIAFPLRSWEYYKRTYRLLPSVLPVPDVFHANDLDTLLVAALLARRHHRPLVYDAQELYTGMHTLPAWYREWLRLQERVLIRRADRVTVVNDAVGEAMTRLYGRRIDAVILNCPPYEPAPAVGAVTVRERCGLAPGVNVMIYSGGLRPGRGIETAMRSLEHLPGWDLVVLGEGPLEPRLRELAACWGLQERIHFTAFVSHDHVAQFISTADVGVIPYENTGANHYLCSPSKLFHYVMAELPIACSDFPFMRRVVVDNRIGATFDPASPASVAAAVRDIAGDPRAYEEMKSRLRALKRRYSWEQEEKRFLSVYESLVPELERR